MTALLVLEDGRLFKGKSLGERGTVIGEVVFNTSMTGYEEILTDPSYRGQLVTLTYPLVGNYGVNKKDNESYRPHLSGLIIKELCTNPNHWQLKSNLSSYLQDEGIVGITDIDTRALTRHIRKKGCMRGIISSKIMDSQKLLSIIKKSELPGEELVKEVSMKKITSYPGNGPRLIIMDFGVKYNIIRNLKNLDAEIITVPYNTGAREILNLSPDGILLSNGPGDPRSLPEVVKEIKKLVNNVPIFGICLGHQLLGMALGCSIYKLKFGHHGGNHPVKNLQNYSIKITSQNHGYAIKKDSLVPGVEVTHINLNDGTIEGIKHSKYACFSLQYHPEAGPGPDDSNSIFAYFIDIIKSGGNMRCHLEKILKASS